MPSRYTFGRGWTSSPLDIACWSRGGRRSLLELFGMMSGGEEELVEKAFTKDDDDDDCVSRRNADADIKQFPIQTMALPKLASMALANTSCKS